MGEVEVYIKIVDDPWARKRGFSLLGRQFKPAFPIIHKTEGISIIDGNRQILDVWIISEREYLKVVPEHESFRPRSKYWLLPAAFCSPIVPTHGKFKRKVSQKEIDMIKKLREKGKK